MAALGNARAAWLHVALFAALAGIALALGFDRSGWILVTQPVEPPHSTNSLLGYSQFLGGRLFHHENYSALLQVAMFLGDDVYPDIYFRRPVYSFVAACLAPVLGVIGALVAVNLAAWAAAAWVVHRFTGAFYGDARAAWWAALLALPGIGFVLHSLDLSAHLLAHAFYMAGVLAVYASRVWERPVAVRTHVALAAFLMLASLQYNTGIALAAAYAVVAIRHNRAIVVTAAFAAAVLAQPIWGAIVGWHWEWRQGSAMPDLSSTEREYLLRALGRWADILGRGEWSTAAGYVGSFLTFEMPLIVAVGAAMLAWDAVAGEVGRRRLRFAAPFIVFPLASALVFAPAAQARGYLVFGIAIFFFAAAGSAISRATERDRRAAALGVLLVVLTAAWSGAHLANHLGPAKAYLLGGKVALPLFHDRWEATSLTGHEPTPRAFGGRASLAEAGLSATLEPVAPPSRRHPQFALAAGALFVLLVAVALHAAVGWRIALVAAAFLALLPMLGGWFGGAAVPESALTRALPIAAGDSIRYRIRLAETVRARLEEELGRGRTVVLYVGGRRDAPVPAVSLSGHKVGVLGGLPAGNWTLYPDDLRAALRTRPADLEIVLHGETSSRGWQAAGLRDREVRSTTQVALPVLPIVELRVVVDEATQAPIFIAF